MAKVMITFEDVDDGVSVKLTADPKLPSERNDLTDAQDLAIRMTELLEAEQGHCHDEHCTHDHHDHAPPEHKV